MAWMTIRGLGLACVLILGVFAANADLTDQAANVAAENFSEARKLTHRDADAAALAYSQAVTALDRLVAEDPDHAEIKNLQRSKKTVEQSLRMKAQQAARQIESTARELDEALGSGDTQAVGQLRENLQAKLSAWQLPLRTVLQAKGDEAVLAAQQALAKAPTSNEPEASAAREAEAPNASAQAVEPSIDDLPSGVKFDAKRLDTQIANLEELAGEPLPKRDDEAELKLKRIKGQADRLREKLAELRTKSQRLRVPDGHPVYTRFEERIAAAENTAPGQAKQLETRQAESKQSAARAERLAESIDAEGDKLEAFVSESGGLKLPSLNANDPDNITAFTTRLDEIEAAREASAKRIDDLLAEHELEPSPDVVVATLKESGVQGTAGVRDALVYVYQKLPEELSQARAQALATSLGLSDSQIESFEQGGIHDFDFDDRLDSLTRSLAAARKIRPNDEAVAAAAQKVDDNAEAWKKASEDRISKRTFEHHPDGDISESTIAGAKDFVRREWEKDGEYELRGLIVTAPWRVTMKNLVGQPTQYGLPVTIAVKSTKDTREDVYRFFELTLVTPESGDPKKEPPFIGNHVGDSGYIRPAVVDEHGG